MIDSEKAVSWTYEHLPLLERFEALLDELAEEPDPEGTGECLMLYLFGAINKRFGQRIWLNTVYVETPPTRAEFN